MLELVPVVTGVAAAAAVWLPGSGDLAIGGGQRLDRCPLLSNANSNTARRSRHCSTGKSKLETVFLDWIVYQNLFDTRSKVTKKDLLRHQTMKGRQKFDLFIADRTYKWHFVTWNHEPIDINLCSVCIIVNQTFNLWLYCWQLYEIVSWCFCILVDTVKKQLNLTLLFQLLFPLRALCLLPERDSWIESRRCPEAALRFDHWLPGEAAWRPGSLRDFGSMTAWTRTQGMVAAAVAQDSGQNSVAQMVLNWQSKMSRLKFCF